MLLALTDDVLFLLLDWAANPLEPAAAGALSATSQCLCSALRPAVVRLHQLVLDVAELCLKIHRTPAALRSARRFEGVNCGLVETDVRTMVHLFRSGAVKLEHLDVGLNALDLSPTLLSLGCCANESRFVTSIGRLRSLSFNGNMIGDIESFAVAPAAFHFLLMRGLTALDLQSTCIGDAGISTLAGACARGGLSQLTGLTCAVADRPSCTLHLVLRQLCFGRLSHNGVGDMGLCALADACGGGALAQLQELFLDHNAICDTGMLALVEVFSRALALLKVLDLTFNTIGRVGCDALARKLSSGAMPNISSGCEELRGIRLLEPGASARPLIAALVEFIVAPRTQAIDQG